MSGYAPIRWLALTFCAGTLAQSWAGPWPLAASEHLTPAQWQFDRLQLADHREYLGLIESRDEYGITFLEIRRPAAAPMFAVGRRIPANEIVAVDALGAAERSQLRQRVEQWRERHVALSEEAARLKLTPVEHGGAAMLEYEGVWFNVRTSLDDATARSCIVRLEQGLGAYRALLPPRHEPTQPLRLIVWSRLEDYQSDLARRGVALSNPAWYDARQGLIVAGTDQARHAAALAETHQRCQLLAAEAVRLETSLAELLRQQGQTALDAGAAREAVRRASRLRRQRLETELKRIRDNLARARRENQALFDTAMQVTLETLFHEAFHAYLDHYIYPRPQYDVPRWLNEGLAQVFQSGLLEAGELRIDGAPAELVAAVRADLTNHPGLTMVDLLTAPPDAYLVAHGADEMASRRHYLYAWAVAQYLVVHRGLLDNPALDAYVARPERPVDPIARFELLTGEPTPLFDQAWRDALLGRPARVR